MVTRFTSDTSAAVTRILTDGYRQMSESEKLRRVRALTLAVQELALADIRARYPHEDDRAHRLRLAARWLGPDLMERAFGWRPKN